MDSCYGTPQACGCTRWVRVTEALASELGIEGSLTTCHHYYEADPVKGCKICNWPANPCPEGDGTDHCPAFHKTWCSICENDAYGHNDTQHLYICADYNSVGKEHIKTTYFSHSKVYTVNGDGSVTFEDNTACDYSLRLPDCGKEGTIECDIEYGASRQVSSGGSNYCSIPGFAQSIRKNTDVDYYNYGQGAVTFQLVNANALGDCYLNNGLFLI